jgi:hypothetical protein
VAKRAAAAKVPAERAFQILPNRKPVPSVFGSVGRLGMSRRETFCFAGLSRPVRRTLLRCTPTIKLQKNNVSLTELPQMRQQSLRPRLFEGMIIDSRNGCRPSFRVSVATIILLLSWKFARRLMLSA